MLFEFKGLEYPEYDLSHPITPIVEQGATVMLSLLFAFIIASFSIGAAGVFYITDSHTPFITDLPFDYYDYELNFDFPGVWFPYKEAACTDLFIGTWVIDSWPCAPYFRVTFVIFKTQNYYANLEHIS